MASQIAVPLPLTDAVPGTPVRGTAAPPALSHRRNLRRQTTGSFTKAVSVIPTGESSTPPSTPPTPSSSKGKGRMTPASSSGTPADSSSLEAELRSALLAVSDHTGKTNISAIKQDIRLLAASVDRQAHAHAADRVAIQQVLEGLHVSVQGITDHFANPSILAPHSPVPLHDLELRVKRLAQDIEKDEDSHGAEMEELQDRVKNIENTGRELSVSVTHVSSTVADALSVLTHICTDMTSLAMSVNGLCAPATQAPAHAGSHGAAGSARRHPRDPSPAPVPSPAVPHASMGTTSSVPSGTPMRDRGRQFSQNRRVDARGPKRARLAGPQAASQPPPPAAAWLTPNLYATARMAWDSLLDGAFAAVQSMHLDVSDRTFALIQFPSLSAALSFVDRWVEHKHRAPSLAAVQARVM
ncbi:hypothetical protein BV20DRAFT_1039991 [Pilatotrama ljubarskyi]|nr:hypothetical protein BV20DRAFT_1039991 [Pilatotrama ljubarskyi]